MRGPSPGAGRGGGRRRTRFETLIVVGVVGHSEVFSDWALIPKKRMSVSLQNDSSGVDLGAPMEAEEQGEQKEPGRAPAAQVHEPPKQWHQAAVVDFVAGGRDVRVREQPALRAHCQQSLVPVCGEAADGAAVRQSPRKSAAASSAGMPSRRGSTPERPCAECRRPPQQRSR